MTSTEVVHATIEAAAVRRFHKKSVDGRHKAGHDDVGWDLR
jgi:hypothetical protein